MKLVAHVLNGVVECRRIRLTNYEEVDVARWIVARCDVRAEEESNRDTRIMLQCFRQPHRDATSASEEFAERRVQRMVAVNPPKPQIAEPSAVQHSAGLQPLERALRRVRIRIGATNDFIGMELLPWSRSEERQNARRGFAANKCVA